MSNIFGLNLCAFVSFVHYGRIDCLANDKTVHGCYDLGAQLQIIEALNDRQLEFGHLKVFRDMVAHPVMPVFAVEREA